MIGRKSLVILTCLLFLPSALAEIVVVEGDGYKARAYFTSAVRNGSWVEILERASFDLENLVLNIDWSNLEYRTYHMTMKAFDPTGLLANEWFYDFTPEDGSWYTWYSFGLGECITVTGTWRFEIYLDDKKVLETMIPVEAKSDT